MAGSGQVIIHFLTHSTGVYTFEHALCHGDVSNSPLPTPIAGTSLVCMGGSSAVLVEAAPGVPMHNNCKVQSKLYTPCGEGVMSYDLGIRNVRTLCYLFDALVRPIMSYGCEMWAPDIIHKCMSKGVTSAYEALHNSFMTYEADAWSAGQPPCAHHAI